MKKTLTLIALMAGSVGAYAQGTIIWSDYVSGFTIDVWSPNPSTPTVEESGNTSTDAPAGNSTYKGVPLGGSATGSGPTAYGNGNAYTIALYASTGSSVAVALTSADEVASSTFYNSGGTGAGDVIESPANGGGAGYAGAWSLNFGNNTLTVLPGTATGNAGSAQVELAAWYSGGGATSYSAAVAAGDPVGNSAIGILTGLGGSNGASSPPSTAPNLGGLGITSFSLATPIPEPSTIVLGVMGASTFLMRLRRKQ
jgi:hypothetical protein